MRENNAIFLKKYQIYSLVKGILINTNVWLYVDRRDKIDHHVRREGEELQSKKAREYYVHTNRSWRRVPSRGRDGLALRDLRGHVNYVRCCVTTHR